MGLCQVKHLDISNKNMPNLSLKIKEDLITALKGKDAKKVLVLRMITADIKNEEIAKKKREGLKDEEIQQIITRSVKRHKDSVASYQQGNRAELAKKEEEEITILQAYLPKQMESSEVEKIVEQAIKKVNPIGPQDFGKVMGLVMKQVKGKADGSVVSVAVKKKLAKK